MAERRTKNDRRGWGDRRRRRAKRQPGAEQTLVIEISDATLTALFLNQSDDKTADRVAGLTIPWRNEAPSLLADNGRAELAAAFKHIAKAFPGYSRGVKIVLSGEFCVTRAIRGTTEVVRGELQRLEQRSRLYLSLGPGEKVLVKSVRAVDARHQHALAAVCNQTTLDALQFAADAAGLQIASIEPALSAACRAVSRVIDLPEEPCILVHVDAQSPEISVFRQGELLLDYRPGGVTKANSLRALLEEHVNRLRRHAGRQLGGPAPKLSRVYLCGDDHLVTDAIAGFHSCDEFEISRVEASDVQATWEFAPGAAEAATVPALGALLRAYLSGAESDCPNLMEHIIASTREPLRPILIKSVVPLAATLLLAVGMTFLNMQQQAEVDVLQGEMDQLAAKLGRSNELRLQMHRADAKYKHLSLLASQLNTPVGKHVLESIANCMPSDVWLSGVDVSDGASVRMTGTSFADEGVYDFVQWLEQAPVFADVALKATEPGISEVGAVIQFSVELGVKNIEDQARKVARRE